MRKTAWLIYLAGCAAATSADSRPTTAEALASSSPPRSSASPATAASRSEDARMPRACQAPLRLAQEAHRLLVAAAAHATRSKSCVDGRGRHVTLEQLHVCPAPSRGKRTVVRAAYRVRVQEEGDTRACGRPGECAWLEPRTSAHEIELAFVESAAGVAIELPAAVPGIEDMTPLDRPHDGECYGRADPFVPVPLALDR